LEKIICHIADGHYLIKEGLKAMLSQYSTVVLTKEASNIESLECNLNQEEPDVLMLDYKTIGFSNLSKLKSLIDIYPGLGVLIISDFRDSSEVQLILNTGVNGILLKECDEEEIMEAIEAIANKERFFCGTILEMLQENEEDGFSCSPVNLSEREIEIIGLITDGLSSKAIADTLFLSIHTVNTHRKNILKKLNVKSSSELVNYAFKIGIRGLV
tara:strand:- start:846 stop:1487 length:642 start_codon:yes stop_codon:yes gene_type:complete